MILRLRFEIANSKMLCASSHNFTVYTVLFFLSSAMRYTYSGSLSYSTLYRTDMPTCQGETMLLTHQCQAPLIHNHTTFKRYTAFSNIKRSCNFPPCLLFTIHSSFYAWCLIIRLDEHRTFAFSLALNAH